MRRGEIAAMRWGHLDKKARVLLIPVSGGPNPRINDGEKPTRTLRERRLQETVVPARGSVR